MKMRMMAAWLAVLALAVIPRYALAMGETATASMKNTDGKDLGTVTMTETVAGVLFKISLKGLPPGAHAFHVHDVGKCEGDLESAGAVYNPFGAQHGFLNPEGPMAGDLPNIVATASGDVEAEMLSAAVTLSSKAEEPVIDDDGAALVIYEKPDDYLTEPVGDAGARIACGVIAPGK